MLLVVVAAGLACGGRAEPDRAEVTTDLTVRVEGAAGDPGPIRFRCARGEPCEARVPRLRATLERRAAMRRRCTAVYGGPERAHVTGTLEGRQIDVVVMRDDGCGIARYRALFEALGRRPPLAH